MYSQYGLKGNLVERPSSEIGVKIRNIYISKTAQMQVLFTKFSKKFYFFMRRITVDGGLAGTSIYGAN
jgi:hypothetical protein